MQLQLDTHASNAEMQTSASDAPSSCSHIVSTLLILYHVVFCHKSQKQLYSNSHRKLSCLMSHLTRKSIRCCH